jgi:hypothetical protein
VNAGLLTALLVMFWAIVGWPLSNDPGPGASRSSNIIRRLFFVIARENSPFLGVFRL